MADSCCEKTIDVRELEGKQRRVLVAVLTINATTFLVMIAAALQSRSTSLLFGGLDNFGDAATYALSIAGWRQQQSEGARCPLGSERPNRWVVPNSWRR